MTEQEWLACEKPTPMLEFLHGKASNRKLRLFVVGLPEGIPIPTSGPSVTGGVK